MGYTPKSCGNGGFQLSSLSGMPLTSAKTCLLAGPQVTPLEACVSGVGTQSPLGFFNFNQVFPGFLTQVLGCSK